MAPGRVSGVSAARKNKAAGRSLGRSAMASAPPPGG